MKELFDAAFTSVNIIPTSFLILILLYWISVIFGALDMDFMDIDVDAGDVDVDIDAEVDIDAQVDLDAEMDAETEIDSGTSVEGALISLNSILSFFNLGKVPFMILMSFLFLSVWSISILSNYYLHNSSFLISLAFLVPNFIASLFISKILSTPFAIMFTKMSENSEDNFEYKGKMCVVLMPVSNSKMGQAEINNNGSIIRVNVLTKKGTEMEKGDSGLIINFIKTKKCYLVEPYKL